MDASTMASVVPQRGTRRHFVRFAVAGLFVCMMVLDNGCTMPRRTFQPEQDEASLDDVSFLHYLATMPVVTVDEGMRAVLLLTGDSTQWPTFEKRYEELRGRGAVKAAWRLRSGRILDKGTLAYMLRTVCDGAPSLNEILASKTGLGDRRYALKACVDEGVLLYGLSHEPVTGGELLSALTKVEQHVTLQSHEMP